MHITRTVSRLWKGVEGVPPRGVGGMLSRPGTCLARPVHFRYRTIRITEGDCQSAGSSWLSSGHLSVKSKDCSLAYLGFEPQGASIAAMTPTTEALIEDVPKNGTPATSCKCRSTRRVVSRQRDESSPMQK